MSDVALLPVDRDGVRLRGREMTRIETFTDAAFAFAVTLLVVSVDAIPTTYAELIGALRGLPAFAISFLLLMVFWYGHWQWSRRYGMEDLPSIVLSCVLVFAVLSYVYPLKYLMSLTTTWLSRGSIGTAAELSSPGELYGIFAIYGFGFAGMSLVVSLLNAHAVRRREELELDAAEVIVARGDVGAWLILMAVGLFSALLALFLPPTVAGWPGWAYMLLPIAMPVYGRSIARAAARARSS